MGTATSTAALESLSCENIGAYVGSIGSFEHYKRRILDLQIDGNKLKEYNAIGDDLQTLYADCGIVSEEHQLVLKE
jgi:hypothetical protein